MMPIPRAAYEALCMLYGAKLVRQLYHPAPLGFFG
jgi:hypothetical protein